MDLSRFESNWLAGYTRFLRQREAFEREFIAPLADEMMLGMLMSMTPDQMRMLQERAPDAWKAVTDQLTGGYNAKRQEPI